MLAGVASDNASIGDKSSVVGSMSVNNEQKGYADIKKSLLNNKNVKKLNDMNLLLHHEYFFEIVIKGHFLNHITKNILKPKICFRAMSLHN